MQGSRRSWDAASYDRVGGPMTEMAAAVVDRLDLRGDEVVLDAGCGTGRVTQLLLDRLPRGRVVAVDADPLMVERARANLPAEVDVQQADLLALDLAETFDVIFSTATFHWVLDHERLFATLFSHLRPGGRLVAQCGGAGNIAELLAAADRAGRRPRYAEAFAGWERPMRYATAEETTALLEGAGFTDVRCWLEARPVVPDEPLEYLATVPLGAHLDRLPDEDTKAAFVEAVAELLHEPLTVGYVRLNLEARRLG